MNPWSTTLLAHLVMAAYPFIGIAIGLLMRSRHRAVLTTLLLGFLFLPSTAYEFGPLHWTRWTAPILTIFLTMLVVEPGRLGRLRLQASDLPVALWCLAPGLSSLSNGLGAYDAASAVVYQTMIWGGIYLIGRLYFGTREALLDLARFVVYGCLIYMPLCLFEWRFSPQLHLKLYGFHQHEFQQSIRAFGYRPTVFLQHGLMVAMWMGMGTFLAGVLTRARLLGPILGLPPAFWTGMLLITFLLMQSMGAVALLFGAWAVLQWTLGTRNSFALWALALLPLTWAGLRTVGALPSAPMVAVASKVSAERGESLGARLYAEDELIRHVRGHELFGWSAWGRDRQIGDDYEQRTLVIDGLWVLTLSRYGLFGLTMLLLTWLFPVVAMLRHLRVSAWLEDPSTLVIGGLTIVIAVSMVDNLMNAMLILPFMLLLGALPQLARERVGMSLPQLSTPPRPQSTDEGPPLGPRILGE